MVKTIERVKSSLVELTEPVGHEPVGKPVNIVVGPNPDIRPLNVVGHNKYLTKLEEKKPEGATGFIRGIRSNAYLGDEIFWYIPVQFYKN